MVVQDDDRSVLHREPRECMLQGVAIVDGDVGVRGNRPVDRQGADSGAPPPVPAVLLVTGVYEKPMEPDLEALGITQSGKLAPCQQEGLLHGVLGPLRIAKDPERNGVASAAGPVEERFKGDFVARLRPLDQPVQHARALSTAPGRALRLIEMVAPTGWFTPSPSISSVVPSPPHKGGWMQFGFTLKPEHDLTRTIALTQQAEAAGFDYGWLFDSHVLWREPYVLLTVMAQASKRLRLGTCVTNPATREPSVTASTLAVLNEVSGGRMDLGIGRGDSARRVLGKPPTTMATLEEAIVVIKALVEGRSIEYEGTELRLTWTDKWTLPVWVAGYGPMALAMTGRVADGVILQLADPDLIRWFVGQVREAEGAAGRPTGSVKVQAAAPAHIGDLERCRERTRWFPALVSNHVVDLVNKYPREQLPDSLTGYIRDRTGYDYLHHAEVGSSNAGFVGDEVTDRFCVLGSVEEHIAKLHELADAGVDQFNIYLMNGDEEAILETYGRDVIPALRDVRAGAAR
jgi:probable F420-dependent oxidoreductase